MRKFYLLLTLSLIFNSCVKDEIPRSLDEEQFNEEVNFKRLKEISFQNLQDRLVGVFDSQNHIMINKGKSSNYFGSVNLNKPVKEIIYENGSSSFTILLNKNGNINDTSLYFDNLVIFQNGKKEVIYVIRYNQL